MWYSENWIKKATLVQSFVCGIINIDSVIGNFNPQTINAVGI